MKGGTSGFDALSGGFHFGVIADWYFNYFGTGTGWYWTSTIWSGDEAYNRVIRKDSGVGREVNYAHIYKWNHMSVRCLKDH